MSIHSSIKQPLTVLLDGDRMAPQQARLGAALAERGLGVVVLDAPKIARQIRDEFGQNCLELTSLPRWLGPLRALHLRAAVRKLGVDVVHLNYIAPNHALWAADLQGPPYIATAWGSDLNREVFQMSAANEALIDSVLAHASAVTADSLPLLQRAEKRMGQNPSPRKIVLWSADLSQFDRNLVAEKAAQFRRDLGIGADQKVLLSPRQPQAHYHIDRLVAAFAASNWAQVGVLVIKLHGKSDEEAYVRDLVRQAEALGIGQRLILAPRVAYADLPGLYALADAAVSLPEADGVPSTFLELMALEVPVIATDLPGYAGVLQRDVNATLVPVADETALVAALNAVLDDPEATAQRRVAAKAWVFEHADWRKSVDAWVALYEQALARPRP